MKLLVFKIELLSGASDRYDQDLDTVYEYLEETGRTFHVDSEEHYRTSVNAVFNVISKLHAETIIKLLEDVTAFDWCGSGYYGKGNEWAALLMEDDHRTSL